MIILVARDCRIEHSSQSCAVAAAASDASARVVFGIERQLASRWKDICSQPQAATYFLHRRQVGVYKLVARTAPADWQSCRSARGSHRSQQSTSNVQLLPQQNVLPERLAAHSLSLQRLLQVHVRSRTT